MYGYEDKMVTWSKYLVVKTSDGLGAEISTFARMYEPPTVAEEHPAFISYAKLPTVLKVFIMAVRG